jgi:hypothetical protein
MLQLNLCFHNGNTRKMKDRKKAVKRAALVFKDGLYLFVCLLIVAGIFQKIDIRFKTPTVVAKEIQTVEVIKEVKPVDERVTKLQTFLKSKNSPMSDYAELIVKEADRNDIGWTWITGISCMESACGLKLPQNSYNAWGLGGSKFMYFKGWEESIKYMSKLIGTSYKHDMLQGIKTRYCPKSDGCNILWTSIVAKASTDILGIE